MNRHVLFGAVLLSSLFFLSGCEDFGDHAPEVNAEFYFIQSSTGLQSGSIYIGTPYKIHFSIYDEDQDAEYVYIKQTRSADNKVIGPTEYELPSQSDNTQSYYIKYTPEITGTVTFTLYAVDSNGNKSAERSWDVVIKAIGE